MASNQEPRKGFGSMFRIIACAYVIYIAFDTLTKFNEIPQNQRIWITLLVLGMAGAALFLLYLTYRDWKATQQRDKEAAARAEMLEAGLPNEAEANAEAEITRAEAELAEDKVEMTAEVDENAAPSTATAEEKEHDRA